MEESGGTAKGNAQILSFIDICTGGLVRYPAEGDIMTGALKACECPSSKRGNIGTTPPASQRQNVMSLSRLPLWTSP